MNKIARHAALPAFAAAIAVLILMTASVYGQKENSAWSLVDLAGDRAALAPVAIGGELRDGFHSTAFRIVNGVLNTSTEVFAQPQTYVPRNYALGGAKPIAGMEYQISGSYQLEAVSHQSVNGISFPIRTAAIPVGGAYLTSGSRDVNASPFANPLEYGLAGEGGPVYFTLPVTNGYRGRSGIYELSFYEWGTASQPGRNPARLAAELDLNAEAERSGGKGVDVLGLEAVGGKLILVMAQGDRLLLRGYDAAGGQVLGEASVPGVVLSGFPERERPEGATTVSPAYEAFPDPERSMLNLSFRVNAPEVRETIVSVDLAGGVRVANRADLLYTDGARDSYNGISFVGFREGRLYVAKTFRQPEAGSESRVRLTDPMRFMLYVFERSEPVYKGELKTDLNDDFIRAIPAGAGSFEYNPIEYRYFDRVKIE